MTAVVPQLADPAHRIRGVAVRELEHRLGPVHRFDITLAYRDMRGLEAEATCKVYLPPGVNPDQARNLPLLHASGYEIEDSVAVSMVARGHVLTNPVQPGAGMAWPSEHPISRGLNLDLAVLHVARSLPWVDDARVLLYGLSAGGRIALMLAAETFPLLGVMADVPPVNYAYGSAYWIRTNRLPKGPPPEDLADAHPWLTADPVTDAFLPAASALGENAEADDYLALSPTEHLDHITCPVSLVLSTADTLVPVDQIGREVVRPADPARFPPGFSTDPDVVCRTPAGRRRLVDGIPGDRLELVVTTPPSGAPPVDYVEPTANGTPIKIEVPDSARQWSVMVIDEGPAEPRVGHFKHLVWPDREALTRSWFRRGLDIEQLTGAKLAVLMSRYRGREWLGEGHRHLDVPAAERADVQRALRTYGRLPGAAPRLESLYQELPGELQVLQPELLKELIST